MYRSVATLIWDETSICGLCSKFHNWMKANLLAVYMQHYLNNIWFYKLLLVKVQRCYHFSGMPSKLVAEKKKGKDLKKKKWLG